MALLWAIVMSLDPGRAPVALGRNVPATSAGMLRRRKMERNLIVAADRIAGRIDAPH